MDLHKQSETVAAAEAGNSEHNLPCSWRSAAKAVVGSTAVVS